MFEETTTLGGTPHLGECVPHVLKAEYSVAGWIYLTQGPLLHVVTPVSPPCLAHYQLSRLIKAKEKKGINNLQKG